MNHYYRPATASKYHQLNKQSQTSKKTCLHLHSYTNQPSQSYKNLAYKQFTHLLQQDHLQPIILHFYAHPHRCSSQRKKEIGILLATRGRFLGVRNNWLHWSIGWSVWRESCLPIPRKIMSNKKSASSARKYKINKELLMILRNCDNFQSYPNQTYQFPKQSHNWTISFPNFLSIILNLIT